MLLLTGSFACRTEAKAADMTLFKPADLFVATNIWTVHLKFTPGQWEAMEPKQDGFSGLVGFRRFGGPDNERGPFGGTAGLGPATLLAQAFLQQGDQNADGKLSREEFRALGAKWFSEWDQDKSGKLNADQLRAGLNASLTPAGRPGGPWGRGPGRNLQGPEGRLVNLPYFVRKLVMPDLFL